MADHGAVIQVHSKDEFLRYVEQSKKEAKPVIIDFTATWCGPCRKIAPEFVKLSTANPNVIFLKVDVDEVGDVCAIFNIRAMPTFILLNPGSTDAAQTIVGADLNKITQLITAANASAAANVAAAAAANAVPAAAVHAVPAAAAAP